MGACRLEDYLVLIIARMIMMIIIRKRPPLVTGLALLTSQLRGLLDKRATYAVRRWVIMFSVDMMILRMMVMIITVDSDDVDNDGL